MLRVEALVRFHLITDMRDHLCVKGIMASHVSSATKSLLHDLERILESLTRRIRETQRRRSCGLDLACCS